MSLRVAVMADSASAQCAIEQLLARIGVANAEVGFSRIDADQVRTSAELVSRSSVDVLVVDLPAQPNAGHWNAIEALKAKLPTAAMFMIGDMDTQTIVRAMQAGGTEYLSRPLNAHDLEAAFARLPKPTPEAPAGKLIGVFNAKPGSGATTIAVNTAMKLQMTHGNTALVDLAPLGHTGLFLNASLRWTILDLIVNLERADATSLAGWMTPCRQGLSLLAGPPEVADLKMDATQLGVLFTLLLSKYSYVVVDLSSRMDEVAAFVFRTADRVLIASQGDGSLQRYAPRIRKLLGAEVENDRICVVLNRCRDVGRYERDAVAAFGAAMIFNIPNQFQAMAGAIARGVPVVEQGSTAASNAFGKLIETFIAGVSDGNNRGILEPLATGGMQLRLSNRLPVFGS